MKKYRSRNTCPMSDSGKTTLSEALMYCSGNITKLGRVDHRDSFLDTFSLERDRGITIFSKQAVMKYNDTEFTLLDTPGHIDFSAEAERTLQVLDYAILVISGTNGVQSHTATLWKLLKRYNVPCFIFVNKMDLDGADKLAVMAQLRTNLDENCIDFTYRNTDAFRESVAVCDDKILEKFYETDSVENSDIVRAIKQRKIFPCMFGSALKLDGVREFIDCFDLYTQMPDYPDKLLISENIFSAVFALSKIAFFNSSSEENFFSPLIKSISRTSTVLPYNSSPL